MCISSVSAILKNLLFVAGKLNVKCTYCVFLTSIDYLANLGNLVANFLEIVEIFQGDLQISFESNTDFPNSLLKFANFLVRCIFIG